MLRWPCCDESARGFRSVGSHEYADGALGDGLDFFLAHGIVDLEEKTVEQFRFEAGLLPGVVWRRREHRAQARPLLAQQALVDAGDEVVVVVPVWPNLTAQPAIMGARVRRVSLRAQSGAWWLPVFGMRLTMKPSFVPTRRATYISTPSARHRQRGRWRAAWAAATASAKRGVPASKRWPPIR